jgi:hypothetical protein
MTTTNYPLWAPSTYPYPEIIRETVSAPLYTEQWHIRPPIYDQYNVLPLPPKEKINKIDDPRKYPYGQLLSDTNLLPGDETKINLWCDKEPIAIAYMNNNFTRQDVEFRDEMMRILKRKQTIRYKNNCYNTFAPYNTF